MKINIRKPRDTFNLKHIIFCKLYDFLDFETAKAISKYFNFPLFDLFINKPFEIFEDYIIIENHDYWNANNTLASIIAPTLQKLKDNSISYTINIDVEDVPEHLRNEDNDVKWNWILSEIIWSFREYNSDWIDQFFVNSTYNKEGYMQHYEKIQNGFRLFSVYFENLWD